MDSLDGGDGLSTGLELSHVVFDHSFNSWDEVEGSGEGREVLDSGGSAGHKMVPVGEGDLGISQSQQDVSELHLVRVLASLPHDLVQHHCLLEGLVGCSPLVRELRARVSGVKGQVHDWRKLAEISEEKTRASSKHLLGVVWEGLAETPINLAEDLPPHHRHLVNDEVLDLRECLLQLGESLSLQVLEFSSGGQAKEGVEGLAIDVEGGHTSWSCNHEPTLQEKSEAVDEVGLPCASCARDNHPQRWGTVG